MNIEVIGDSAVSAFLAASLGADRHAVTWYTCGARSNLRPVLLRAAVVGRLRRFLEAHNVSTAFLARAPQVEHWGIPDRPTFRFRFDFLRDETDRWVDGGDLARAMTKAARHLGVAMRTVPLLPAPSSLDGGESLCLVDVDECEVPHWQRSLATFEETRNAKWQVTEIHFHETASEDPALHQFGLLEGSLAFLEPNPMGGCVLTLFAKSRYSIERALKSLSHSKGEGPRLWQVLYLMNPGARRRDWMLSCGPSRLDLSGTFPLGASLGVFPPCLNLQVSESFEQAERLLDFVERKGERLAVEDEHFSQEWIAQERRRFLTLEKRMSLWERCLSSERFHSNFVTVASMLPQVVRDYLKTPL